MKTRLTDTIKELENLEISAKRRQLLDVLVAYIKKASSDKSPINLNFICTHNSRRSHMSQVWAQAAAKYFGIQNIHCYSGGTESTSVFPVVIDTLKEQGFDIQALSKELNPVYAIRFDDQEAPLIAFSKTYDNNFNPKSFAAIMTCDHADQNCPFIPSATARIPITYQDPKAFDKSPLQKERYEERSRQIGSELLYVMKSVAG